MRVCGEVQSLMVSTGMAFSKTAGNATNNHDLVSHCWARQGCRSVMFWVVVDVVCTDQMAASFCA